MSTRTNETESDEAFPLKVYLRNKLIELNPDQILRVQEVIDTPHQSQQINYNMKSGFVYRFDVSFTFLHSLCGETNAQKIKQILDHKHTLVLIGIAMILLLTFLFLFPHLAIIVDIVTWITLVLWILWLLLKHLLLNKTAFKLCIKSFDFWIKIGYGFMWSLSLSISLSKAAAFKSWFVLFIFMLALLAMMSSIISYIAAFDASNTSQKKKLIMSVFGSLAFSFLFIWYQFFQSEEDWYIMKWKSSLGMHTISTLSLVVSSLRIIAIFFWKQSHKTWKGKGIKAVSISKEPTLYWFDSVAQQKEADDAENDNKTDIVSVHEMTAHISKLSSATKPSSAP
eukprot:162775_1